MYICIKKHILEIFKYHNIYIIFREIDLEHLSPRIKYFFKRPPFTIVVAMRIYRITLYIIFFDKILKTSGCIHLIQPLPVQLFAVFLIKSLMRLTLLKTVEQKLLTKLLTHVNVWTQSIDLWYTVSLFYLFNSSNINSGRDFWNTIQKISVIR